MNNFSFFQEEWNHNDFEKLDNTLNKNQAINIVIELFMSCNDKDGLKEDYKLLINYLKNKL